MKRILNIAPTVLPVTLDEIKGHLSVTDTGRDDLLAGYIETAVEHIQEMTGRKLITQTWDLILDYSIGDISLPFGRLQEVNLISYVDSDEAQHTVPATDYYVEGIGTDEGKIRFKDTFSFPTLYDFEPITVTFTCGYGNTGAAVPSSLKAAIQLKVEDLFLGGEENERSVKSLYMPFKITWGF